MRTLAGFRHHHGAAFRNASSSCHAAGPLVALLLLPLVALLLLPLVALLLLPLVALLLLPLVALLLLPLVALLLLVIALLLLPLVALLLLVALPRFSGSKPKSYGSMREPAVAALLLEPRVHFSSS